MPSRRRLARWALLLVALIAAPAGCDSGAEERDTEVGARRLIGDWVRALNAGEYDRAASFFARDAVVDQGRPFRLRSRAAARFFNASLPCRADLVEVEDEPGPEVLASFTLREGPGGPCTGTAKVRFTIRAGRFTEWRQLPQEEAPTGPVV
jgi:hypothetical protein